MADRFMVMSKDLRLLGKVNKASFASASERGRYAAEQRWKGHVKADVAQSILDRVKSYGGLSVKILSGEEPTTGFMVAVRGMNMEVPETEFFDAKKGRAALVDFLKKHREALSGDKYLGLWWDTKNKEVVFDVVDNIADRAEAVAAGKDRNQQAIWDVENGEEISTGGSGDRGAEGAVGKAAEADFGDERRGDRSVRGSFVGGRDSEFGDAEKVEGVLVAISEDGDRLVQTGATADLRRLGFESDFSGPYAIAPIPFGRVEYADGGWRRVNSLDSILRTGFWRQVAEIKRTEDASDPFEKAAFASRSEAGRYAAEQRWKGRGRQGDAPKFDVSKLFSPSMGNPPNIELTPTWDEEEAKRTGRPWAPLLRENMPPEIMALLEKTYQARERFFAAREVFRPIRQKEIDEFRAYKKKADAIIAAYVAKHPDADWSDRRRELERTIGWETAPQEYYFTYHKWIEQGLVSAEAAAEYEEAEKQWGNALRDAEQAIRQHGVELLGHTSGRTAVTSKTPLDEEVALKYGERLAVQVLYPFREQPDLIHIDTDGNEGKDFRLRSILSETQPDHAEKRARQQRMIDDPRTRVIVFVPPRRLTSVIDAGRLKTQHETGTSGGLKDPVWRKAWEGWSLGMHPNMDPTKRPVFGVLAVGGVREPYAYGAEQYGRVGIVLKRDVHSRSMFTHRDSLNGASGTPLSGVQEKLSIDLDDKQFEGGRASSGANMEFPTYHEAQVFGGVSVKDIDYITVPRGVVSKSALDKARKAGIRVVEYDSENRNSGEKERYGKGGEILQPKTADGLWGVLPEPAEKMLSRLEIIDALLKGRFASRSEAARYAAEQRWKGHVKDDGGDKVARLRALLSPEIVAELMAAGEGFGASESSRGRNVDDVNEYLADQSPAALVTVQNIDSVGQFNPKTGSFNDPRGETLTVVLPNATAMRIDDQVNQIGLLAHEIILERMDAAIGEAAGNLPRLAEESKAAAEVAMERRAFIRDNFGVRPESNSKSAKWGLVHTYRGLGSAALSFPDPPNGASAKYRVAADTAKAAFLEFRIAADAASKAEQKLKDITTNLDLAGNAWYERQKIKMGQSTLTPSEQARFMEAFDAQEETYRERNAKTDAFKVAAVKAAKLYEKEGFGETLAETNKRSLAAAEAYRQASNREKGVYGREFAKLAQELGVEMFDGVLPDGHAFARISRQEFSDSLKVLPKTYVEAPFTKYKIEVARVAGGGAWSSWAIKGSRPSRITTDGSVSTNLHEVTHAAADAIPFVSMMQRTLTARRMMGIRVSPIQDVSVPPRPEDGPEAVGRIKQEKTTFVRRPLEMVAREGVERYYQGRYQYGNRFVRDQFVDDYAGRVYDDDARESMTRGVEYLFGRNDRNGIPPDVDHVASVMGTLLVVGLSGGGS